ncbi:hypothetical protein BGZ83_007296 [Gryganskiella cystojenkinii]|nr:hypothetical protein BGZ83_007296 [Gryganskiella cystojenkinii]
MKPRALSSVVFLASAASADVTFNVVGYPNTTSGSFGVSIDGQITKLSTTPAIFPLWSGTVPRTPSSIASYKYVQLDAAGTAIKSEPFSRTLQSVTDLMTDNEFFEREVTRSPLPLVPLVYDPWVMSKTKIFDDTEIATIHLTGDQAAFEGMLMIPKPTNRMRVDFRWINHNLVHSVPNITLALSGKSSMDFNKMAFKLEFDHNEVIGQSFFSRPSIKLRSETQDPTLMREKVYIDVLNSIGVPTQQGVWIRLYMNSNPVGLYLMVDDIGKSFLKQTIHHGLKNQAIGSLWQMNAPLVETQADLAFLGPTEATYSQEIYRMKTLGSNPPLAPLTQLIQFMQDLKTFDPQAAGAVAFWENKLDLDGYLRNMAMEYLGGSWDAYWYSGSNYFMYNNPVLGKWQWIPTDFDGTFGNGDPTETLPPYQTWADFSKHDRPLITKLILNNRDINARFEQILREVVGYAFKPQALNPRIDAMEKMLSFDIAWEYGIDRTKYPGKTNAWTVDDFHKSLAGPVKNMNLGVKPWIQGQKEKLEIQLGFKVVEGTPDRVKRPTHSPDGGSSDTEVGNGAAATSSDPLWAAMALLPLAMVLWL